MAQRAKVLVIGLDTGDGRLLGEWARAGRLPVLASLIEGGRWQALDTPAETLHIAGWPGLYTGATPGEHGVYFTFQPAPGQQGWLKFTGDQYGRPTFWQLLSHAGVRCTVFDAPYTHPEAGSDALQIIDWGSWAPYWKPASLPPGVIRRLGRYPLGFHALEVGMGPLDPEEMRGRLVAAARAKTDAACRLMDEHEWDLFFAVFGETHAGAHYCWDPAEPAAEGGTAQPRLRDVYEEIDRGIGRLIASAGPDVAVYVVSTDGVGPNHAGWHLLPEVLRRLGYLAEPSADPAPDGRRAKRSFDPVRLLRDALPRDFRKALARRLLPDAVRHRLARRVDTAAIDWSRTRAFCLPTDLEGYIRINLRGREPQGIVAPGEDYRRVCDELVAALGALVNPATGRPAVRAVVRSDDAFPGPRRAYLPDLVVLWNGEAAVSAVASAGVGTVSGASPDGRPGTHTAPGFLLRAGADPGTEAGERGHVRDLAPELLERFGVAVPDHMRATAGRARAAAQGGTS